jgi:hypothetical protein
VLETPSPAAVARFSELLLRVFVNSPATNSSVTAPVAPDGSFRVTGLSGGVANVFLGSPTTAVPPKGFSLLRLEHEGVVQPRGLPIQEREQLTGVRVVLAYGTATIRGVVEIENGTLPSGAWLYVGLLRPGERISSLRPTPVDARGHFMIEGVAAGTYVIQATISGVPNMVRQVKREISVQDGVTTDITLTIDMNPPPQKP